MCGFYNNLACSAAWFFVRITISSSLFCWLRSFPHCDSLPFLLASFVIWVTPGALSCTTASAHTGHPVYHTQPADALASLPGICLEWLWSVLPFCALTDSSTLLLGRILVSVLNSFLRQRTIYVPPWLVTSFEEGRYGFLGACH